MRFCHYKLDHGSFCNRTFELNEIFFHDPYDFQASSSVFLCRIHYNNFVNELNEELITMKRKLDNLHYQDRLERKLAKENDVIYQAGSLQYTIETLKEKYKYKALKQCRNIFCNASLETMDNTKKIYSVITFKPNGKRHNTFYLCSLKCFRAIKGKCGIEIIVERKQETLF